MSKKQTRRIKRIIVLGALLWLIRSIFFLKKEVFWGVSDILQWLINVIEDNKPTEDIFEGDIMTENIYKKALVGHKRKTANIMNISLEKIQFNTSWLNTNIVKQSDLLNILYNSNDNVSAGIDFLCEDCKISPEDIKKSYRTIIPELKRIGVLSDDNDNVVNRSRVDEWINSQFSIISDSKTYLSSFTETNKGEDLFVNGVAEDSDYDLLKDIESIWDTLFESFIAPIETVFYKLPPISKGSADTSVNTSKEKQELLTLLQNSLAGSWGTNTGSGNTNGSQLPPAQKITSTPGQTTTTNANNDSFNKENPELQEFVEKNKRSQNTTTQRAGIQGDMCRDGVSEWPTSLQEGEEEPLDEKVTEAYLSAVQTQINTYNTLSAEDAYLPNIFNNPALSGMTPSQTNQFIEEYINDLFDVSSTESCIKKCNSLPAADRVVCQIQCLCFTMTWPNSSDPRTKSMNEMVKLRFCMVPAKSERIPKGKNIYSLDDILARIQTNMDDVVNGGEMVKFQKTKEFLDNPIADFSFSKLISFQINLNTKPIFNNKSAMAKKDQEENNKKQREQINGKEQTLGLNPNKYVVIQDTIKHDIYQEPAESPEAYLQKYEKEVLAAESKQRENEKTTDLKNSLEMTKKKSEMLTIIIEFLSQNIKFREQTEKEIQNINNTVYSLQSKL